MKIRNKFDKIVYGVKSIDNKLKFELDQKANNDNSWVGTLFYEISTFLTDLSTFLPLNKCIIKYENKSIYFTVLGYFDTNLLDNHPQKETLFEGMLLLLRAFIEDLYLSRLDMSFKN